MEVDWTVQGPAVSTFDTCQAHLTTFQGEAADEEGQRPKLLNDVFALIAYDDPTSADNPVSDR